MAIEGASAIPMDASTCMHVPNTKGYRRPTLSDSGPTNN